MAPKRVRTAVRMAVAGAVVLAVAAVALVVWVFVVLPDPSDLAHRNPTGWAFLERARNAGQGVVHRWVPLDAISDELKLAVLVAEDINFFDHHGFDKDELRFAVRDWLAGKRLRGASTISQQLVKNLWLSPRRSVWRKLEEAVLTWKLERDLPKRRILELYLNVVQFGPGVFGAEAAARRYFGIPASELTAEQAAALAAALSRPSRWHPGVDSKAYRARVALILKRMRGAGWLRAKL